MLQLQLTRGALPSTAATLAAALRVRAIVIKAILIRDMRTRFGGTHLAYLLAIGWPLSHLVIMVLAFAMLNRALPFGTDSVVFISTGALPYILCLYPARMMCFMMAQTGSILSFPIVQPLDLIIARAILESLSAFVVVIIFGLGLWAIDVDIVPADTATAITGIYASVFFGVSIGAFAIVLRALLKGAGFVMLICTLLICYLTSGVYVPVTPSNELARAVIGYNPIYQLVAWLRAAYFETHNAVPLDKHYVLLLSALLLVMGLIGERLFRGKLLTSS